MKIILTNPTINDEREILEFIDEYKGYSPEIDGVDQFEGVDDFSNITDFKEWIHKVDRLKIEKVFRLILYLKLFI